MAIYSYKRPYSILFLDDDPLFLEGLSAAFSSDMALTFYCRPESLIAQLETEQKHLKAEYDKHLYIAEKIRNCESSIFHMLEFWRANKVDRFSATGIVVIDYAMPSMNGLQAIASMQGWDGVSVLLTGQADEAIAIAAFNERLIHQYIPKQSSALFARLNNFLLTASPMSMVRLHNIWSDLLTPEQRLLLSMPDVEQSISTLIMQHQWVEYVVISRPFGILGMCMNGHIQWLQIEDLRYPHSREELAELAADSNMSKHQIEAIKAGALVMDLELQLDLRMDQPVTLKPSISLGNESSKIVACVFNLSDQHALRLACWEQFLAGNGRKIHY